MEIHCKYDALVALPELLPNPLNANDHSDEQIERLCLLFETYGIRHPIICDKDTKVIAVGHGRLLAAKRLKLATYPVVYQKFRSVDEFDQFAIADNSIALWAELNLKLINERLPTWGPELNIKALAIRDFFLEPADKLDPDKEWEGLPEFEAPEIGSKIIVSIDDESRKQEFISLIGAKDYRKHKETLWSLHWPQSK